MAKPKASWREMTATRDRDRVPLRHGADVAHRTRSAGLAHHRRRERVTVAVRVRVAEIAFRPVPRRGGREDATAVVKTAGLRHGQRGNKVGLLGGGEARAIREAVLVLVLVLVGGRGRRIFSTES